jgi:ferredoxin-fold anticodon binding domain-containing protein
VIAKLKIEKECPNLDVFIIYEGSFVTEDYITNRIRIFKNFNNKVSSVPKIG